MGDLDRENGMKWSKAAALEMTYSYALSSNLLNILLTSEAYISIFICLIESSFNC